MSLNDDIADAIIGHHVRVLRLASGAFDRVAFLLRDLDKQTIDLLMRAANSNGVIKRVEMAVQAVYQLNLKTYRQIGRELSVELSDLTQHEIDFSHGLMRKLTPDVKFNLPPKAYVRAIVSEEPLFGGLLSEWVDGLAQGRYQRIRNAIRLAAAANTDVMTLARKIRGRKALGYRDGLAILALRSAKMLTNTAYSHIANKARYDFFMNGQKSSKLFGGKTKKKKKDEDYEIEGFMWSATLDSDTCPICFDLDGQYFPADEYYEIQSSAHPNCRCVGIPMVDVEEFEFARPKKLRYEDWLKRQTASFQDEILGKERAAMFRRGMSVKQFTDASGIRYNLSELRKIEATMTAKTKTVTNRSKANVLHNWGFFPDLPDKRDHKFGLVHKEEVKVPTKISLRKMMPPVWEQGALGSCVAFSSIAAYMFAHRSAPRMSALDLYWKARFLEDAVNEDSGCMIRDAVKALQKWGVCTEKTWPYLIRKFKVDPPAEADREALKYRITSYARVVSLQDCMNCLARGYPFVVGFSVYESFLSETTDKTGIIMMPGDKNDPMVGGHAVLVTGLDQNFHENPVFKRSGLSKSQVPNFMFEFRNSWSVQWGDGGYGYIPAEYVNDSDLSSDMWMIRA